MSALCAAARSRMRRLTVCALGDGVGDLVAVVVLQPHAEVRRPSAKSDMKSAVAMRVLLGTQSVSTAAPPRPSRSTTVTCGAELGGDEGRLVAAGAAAEDDNRRLARDHGVHPTIPERRRPAPEAAGDRPAP